MWAFGSWLMCFSGVLLDKITQLHHAEYKTLLRLCASVSGTLSPKIYFYLEILMWISKCNGQVGLDVTSRSLEIHQRRLWSQHLFSCTRPPKCSSSVFISMDVCFCLFFRVSLRTHISVVWQTGQKLCVQRLSRKWRRITSWFTE